MARLTAIRANLLVARTCQLLNAAYETGAEFIIENPADRGDPSDSYAYLHRDHAPLWVMPEIQALKTCTRACARAAAPAPWPHGSPSTAYPVTIVVSSVELW